MTNAEPFWLINPLCAHQIRAGFPTSFSQNRKPIQQGGRVAVIYISGVITKDRAPGEPSIGTTIVEIDSQIDQAVASDADAILFIFDSPGGSVAGLPQLADKKFGLRKTKIRTIALISGTCASAVYYLASQCDEIYSDHPSNQVGSIGVVSVFYDQSKAFEKNGIEPVVFTSGPLKAIGVPGVEMTPEMRKYLQTRIDEIYGYFSAAVQRGRGMSANLVKGLSDGRTWNSTEAKAFGLIDGIQSLEQTITNLSGTTGKSGTNMSATSFKDQFAAKVEANKSAGLNPSQAVAKVVKEFPELRDAMNLEAKGVHVPARAVVGRPAATPGAAKKAWDTAISQLTATGLTAAQAASKLERTAPHLRQNLLAETTA